MKSIQHVIRKTLLCAALALMASGTARATWFEQPVAGVAETVYADGGAVDTNWNIYYCYSTTGKLYAIYNPGPGANWTGSPLVANCYTGVTNAIACDPVNHWTFYCGSDGYIWVIYWTGSAWASNKVGSNLNYGRQLCVDTVYHCLWYIDGSGYLWILYWNGSAWVEVKIDGTNQRVSGGRFSGCDSIWHIAWYVTSDQKSLRGTYWNGSGWTNGTPLTGRTMARTFPPRAATFTGAAAPGHPRPAFRMAISRLHLVTVLCRRTHTPASLAALAVLEAASSLAGMRPMPGTGPVAGMTMPPWAEARA
jgi:hypothetical protein